MRIDRFSSADARRGSVAAVLAGLLLTACGAADVEVDAGGPDQPATGSNATGDSGGVPQTELTTFTGDTTSFEAYRGTPVVVNFWASWCPPCVAEMPDFEAVHQAAGGRVDFVGVNTQDSPGEAGDLVEQTGVTYDLVRDPSGQLARDFGVFGMPSTFFVDAAGQIVGRHTGFLTEEALLQALEDELGISIRTAS